MLYVSAGVLYILVTGNPQMTESHNKCSPKHLLVIEATHRWLTEFIHWQHQQPTDHVLHSLCIKYKFIGNQRTKIPDALIIISN